ncbi:MAG: hypothetical protein AAF386_10765 [Pseudomonadota bacterium]
MIIDQLEFSAFRSLWFWLLLLVQWGSFLLRPMGIPTHAVFRLRQSAAAQTVAAYQIDRWAAPAPVWAIGVIGFVVSIFATVGIIYRLELAVAGLVICLPWILVAWLTQTCAVKSKGADPKTLQKQLSRLTFWTQIIGLVVFFTASFVGIFFIDPFLG